MDFKGICISTGSAYGLEILQILSTDKPEITIDGNRLSENQFVVNKTGTTRTVTIKISALQNLSVGKHTLVITENNVPTTYELNINEKSISDYEIISAGNYTVDAASASPLTGITQSNAVPFVIISCLLITLAVVAVLLIFNKKKKTKALK